MMRKRKISIMIMLAMMTVCLLGIHPAMQTNAAEGTETQTQTLIQTVSAQKTRPGTWVKDRKGWWYRYNNGRYPADCWKKIGNKIYRFNKNGYMMKGVTRFEDSTYLLDRKNGHLRTGWVKMKKNRWYYAPKGDGAAVTGWQYLRYKKGAQKWYYFNELGVMQSKCWVGDSYVGEDGSRVENQWVDDYYLGEDGVIVRNAQVGDVYVGEDGRVVEDVLGGAAVADKIIFVGDSRTVGMGAFCTSDAQFIAKVGEGFEWMANTAVKKLNRKLAVNPNAKVILNFGVNDLGNIDAYITYYSAYMQVLATRYPDAKVYIMSVNPVDRKLYKGPAQNKLIKAFNLKMKTAFPTQYIDSFTYLQEDGFGTVDGLHYDADTYNKIYNFAIEQIQ